MQWERTEDGLTGQLISMLNLAESGADPAGWDNSAELYRFMTLLKINGTNNQLPSLSTRLERVHQLLLWLERIRQPRCGIGEMAERLHIGTRQLNERFKESFGQSAYAYLIQLRLRKAKEWLPSRPEMTVAKLASGRLP